MGGISPTRDVPLNHSWTVCRSAGHRDVMQEVLTQAVDKSRPAWKAWSIRAITWRNVGVMQSRG